LIFTLEDVCIWTAASLPVAASFASAPKATSASDSRRPVMRELALLPPRGFADDSIELAKQ
jgi:hypothetical protein